MKLGNFYKRESLTVEHKEFTLHKTKSIANKLILFDFLNNFKFTNEIKQLFIKSLFIYCKEYLPKYICSFSNSNINGELNIGINNIGFVTGIPYKGDLPFKKIKKKIYSIIETSIQQKIKIQENIEIKLIKVTNQIQKKSINIKQKIEKCNNKKDLLYHKLSEVQKEQYRWKKKMAQYQALVGIITTSKTCKELYDFIIQKKNILEFKFKFKLTFYTKENQFFTKKITQFYDFWLCCKNFTLPDHDRLQIEKKNKNNILYWLVIFKDYSVDSIQTIKPNFVKIKKRIYRELQNNGKQHPVKYLFRLTPLIQNFLNENYDYYVLKIVIRGKNLPNNLLFQHPDIFEDTEWYYKKRIIIDDEPLTI